MAIKRQLSGPQQTQMALTATTFTRVHIDGYPEMYAIRTSSRRYFFCDKNSYQILSGLDNASTKKTLQRYYERQYDGKEFPSVIANPPDSEHVCTFVNPTSGKLIRAFSLTGLEFLCNHITGKNVEENKPKFLELIRMFRASIDAPPAEEHTQMIAVMRSLPLVLAQAIAEPLKDMVTRYAETFNEQVREMAKTMAEKDMECEKVKHMSELQKTKNEAEMQAERTRYESEIDRKKNEADKELDRTKNEAKIKDMEKNHQIELERSKHSMERAQWELKAASIRQAQRDGQETVKPEIFKPVELPPSQHANLKADAACLWLAMYDSEQKRDAIDFNQINTFAKACSSVMIDRENDTWVGLIELERPMVFADLANEMKLLAQKVFSLTLIRLILH